MRASSVSSLAETFNGFGFRLLAELARGKPANTLISPASIAMALTLACNGAAGETQQAMAQALGIDGLSLKKVNQGCAGLLDALATLDPRVEISLASAVWVAADAKVKPAFVEIGRLMYRAEIRNISFDEAAVKVINEWVEAKTQGRVRQLLGPGDLTPATLIALLNAIYFKGVWARAFESNLTREGVFTRADGTTQPAMLMRQSGKFAYFSNERAQVVRLPYGTGRASMMIALPRPKIDIGAFAREMNAAGWARLTHPLLMREGSVVLPRFKVECALRLNDALSALGMGVAFGDQANFSAMFARDHAHISVVQHKAFVEVNEEGTEAAAATAVVMAKTLSLAPAPFHFVADRPFCFAIEDGETGVILFLGVVTHV